MVFESSVSVGFKRIHFSSMGASDHRLLQPKPILDSAMFSVGVSGSEEERLRSFKISVGRGSHFLPIVAFVFDLAAMGGKVFLYECIDVFCVEYAEH